MAEYLLAHRLGPESNWTVGSAGTIAAYGMGASPAALTALEERGIDGSAHRSRPLDKELVDSAAVIVVMTASHREQLRTLFPQQADKVFTLKSFDAASQGGDVDDPLGLSVDAYRDIRDEIEAALPGLIEFMRVLDTRDTR
jgi:protein-tyrosine-phosphatase